MKITVRVCAEYSINKGKLTDEIMESVRDVKLPKNWTITRFSELGDTRCNDCKSLFGLMDTNYTNLKHFISLEAEYEFETDDGSLTDKDWYKTELVRARNNIRDIMEQIKGEWESKFGPLPLIWFNDCPIYYPIDWRSDEPWYSYEPMIIINKCLDKEGNNLYGECEDNENDTEGVKDGISASSKEDNSKECSDIDICSPQDTGETDGLNPCFSCRKYSECYINKGEDELGDPDKQCSDYEPDEGYDDDDGEESKCNCCSKYNECDPSDPICEREESHDQDEDDELEEEDPCYACSRYDLCKESQGTAFPVCSNADRYIEDTEPSESDLDDLLFQFEDSITYRYLNDWSLHSYDSSYKVEDDNTVTLTAKLSKNVIVQAKNEAESNKFVNAYASAMAKYIASISDGGIVKENGVYIPHFTKLGKASSERVNSWSTENTLLNAFGKDED